MVPLGNFFSLPNVFTVSKDVALSVTRSLLEKEEPPLSVHSVETPAQRRGFLKHRTLWLGVVLVLLLLTTITVYMTFGRTTTMPTTNSNTQHSENGAAPGNVLATITNSGSTNTQGFTLTIYNDGSGSLIYQQREGRSFPANTDKHFPAGTFNAQQLATLLKEVGDVSTLPQGGCMKSASFGTRTTITYNGKTSSDLSCPSAQDTPTFKTLRQTALAMVKAAK
jgi:hypothetical protein